jgi:hypothetical protein
MLPVDPHHLTTVKQCSRIFAIGDNGISTPRTAALYHGYAHTVGILRTDLSKGLAFPQFSPPSDRQTVFFVVVQKRRNETGQHQVIHDLFPRHIAGHIDIHLRVVADVDEC